MTQFFLLRQNASAHLVTQSSKHRKGAKMTENNLKNISAISPKAESQLLCSSYCEMSTEAEQSVNAPLEFRRASHVKYLKYMLNVLPSPYTSLDTSRPTALYFCLTGLDILGELDSIDKAPIIDFIYTLQLSGESQRSSKSTGFIGGNFANHTLCGECNAPRIDAPEQGCTACSPLGAVSHQDFHQGHIAITYSALVSLLTLGDDLGRVNKTAIITSLKELQMPDGAFRATLSDSGEADVRFLFCACAISAILQDWSALDRDRAVGYIRRCVTYEGGIAVMPDGEATGGSAYCAIAALRLMDRLDALPEGVIQDVIRWSEARQVNGYQGRTNKDPDSCYSFWVGATLALLRRFDTTDIPSTQTFLLRDCQQSVHTGGFSKLPDCYADLLHTFYSLCWLSMAGYDGLKSIDPRLGICSDKSPLS